MEKIMIEKSERQKETNKKFTQLLQKYNYDPKSKTIEVDGHRVKVNVDREDPNNAHASTRMNGKYIEKIDGITVGKNSDERTLLHEVGHVRYNSNKRKINREPRFDNKYGLSSLDKDTRRKLVKYKKNQNKANNLSDKDFYKDMYDISINRGSKKTDLYKQDEDQQRIKKLDDFHKGVLQYRKIDDDNLNDHDKRYEEFYADLYAMKHGNSNKKFTDEHKKSLIKKSCESNHQYINNKKQTKEYEQDKDFYDSRFKKYDKETKKEVNARQRSRNRVAKHVMHTIESVYDCIFESLQEKVNAGEITLEFAELVNDLAYEKYVENDDKEFKETLIEKASKDKFTEKDYKHWSETYDEEGRSEKIYDLLKKKDLGYCHDDENGNKVVYSFKAKKFYLFDHEKDGMENLEKDMSIERVKDIISKN